MGRESRPLAQVATGGGAIRHRRSARLNAFNTTSRQELVARKAAPKLRHQTYLELVENTQKKKKLDVSVSSLVAGLRSMSLTPPLQFTNDCMPPPGFEFIRTGNPTLTSECKELCRQMNAKIYIVSVASLLDQCLRLAADTLNRQAKR